MRSKCPPPRGTVTQPQVLLGEAWPQARAPRDPNSSGSRRKPRLQPRGHSLGPTFHLSPRGGSTHLDIFLRFLSSALAFWADVRLSASARLSTAIARKTLRRMSTGQLRRPELRAVSGAGGLPACVLPPPHPRPESLRGQFPARVTPLWREQAQEHGQVLGGSLPPESSHDGT